MVKNILLVVSLIGVVIGSIVYDEFPVILMIIGVAMTLVYDMFLIGKLSIKNKKEFLLKTHGIFMMVSTLVIMSLAVAWVVNMFTSISDSTSLFYIICGLQVLLISSCLIFHTKEGKNLLSANILLILAILTPRVRVNFRVGITELLCIIPFVMSILFGIYNLVKGVRNQDKNRKKFGIVLMIIPVIAVISLVLGAEVLMIVLLVLSFIFAIVYSIKNRITSGKIFSGIAALCMVGNIVILIGINSSRVYSSTPINYYGSSSGNPFQSVTANTATSASVMSLNSFATFESMSLDSSKNLGFSVGGAKDINNFRENIENGYLPQVTDITYEGLFYDYYFDTGRVEVEDEMFYPSYTYASANDPLSGEQEHYLSVGLNSNIKESDFIRKKLNLVVVLDISGSMSSQFNSYYYDRDKLGEILENMNESEDQGKSKMRIASESVNILLDQLKDDDKFGLVLFESGARVHTDLTEVSELNIEKTKREILAITDRGGTNFEAGYTLGTALLDDCMDVNPDEFENRIIVLTDAMPNIGRTSGLMSDIKQNARNNINTTFIGIGVDFNTAFIEEISAVRGANYYSVHNSKEFKERMGEQFEFMVTPLVFDLEMSIESEDYTIETVYGTNEADNATNQIMYVNTLFPSKSDDNGEVKGGIILIKLNKTGKGNSPVELKVTYEDRMGNKHSNVKTITIPEKDNEQCPNTGIRKAIALTRYCNLLKNWVMYEKSNNNIFFLDDDTGINEFNYTDNQIQTVLSIWERQSNELVVSEKYKETFETFKEYLEKEVKAVGDKTMNQEVELLETLLDE